MGDPLDPARVGVDVDPDASPLADWEHPAVTTVAHNAAVTSVARTIVGRTDTCCISPRNDGAEDRDRSPPCGVVSVKDYLQVELRLRRPDGRRVDSCSSNRVHRSA